MELQIALLKQFAGKGHLGQGLHLNFKIDLSLRLCSGGMLRIYFSHTVIASEDLQINCFCYQECQFLMPVNMRREPLANDRIHLAVDYSISSASFQHIKIKWIDHLNGKHGNMGPIL